MKDPIHFQVSWDERPEGDGSIYSEWAKCVGCGKETVCLHVYTPGTQADTPGVCKTCVAGVFKSGEKYYRENR